MMPPPLYIVPPLPRTEAAPPAGHRTREQIITQMEARYAELEEQGASPVLRMPCKDCRHKEPAHQSYCAHPLILGFDTDTPEHVDRCLYRGAELGRVSLCGPEKALWEPKLTRWQRLLKWLGA